MRFAHIIIAFLICGSLSSQDIIVRITGDTLRVKVDSQNNNFVYYFSADSKRGDVEVISRKEISQILYNFETPDKELGRRMKRNKRDYQLVQVYGQFVGYYMKNSEVPSGQLKEYYEELQFGVGYKLGVNYFLSKQVGVGLIHSNSQFSNSISVTYANTLFGTLSDNISINYLGANAVLRFELGNLESNLLLSVGFGMNYFQNDGEIIFGYQIKANDFGFHGSAALNLSLGGGLAIPISLGYIGNFVGNFSLKTAGNMPAEFKEGLEYTYNSSNKLRVERIFVGIGLSFAF